MKRKEKKRKQITLEDISVVDMVNPTIEYASARPLIIPTTSGASPTLVASPTQDES